jgi:hypothetical protein
MKNIYLILLLNFVTTTQLFGEYNSVRVAYNYNGPILDSSFVLYAKKFNYNFIIGEFHFRDVSNPTKRIARDMKKPFKLINRLGLQLIPKIQINSSWSSNWKYVYDNENGDIEMNLVWAHNRSRPVDMRWWGCPSFAPDSLGIDKSFEDLIREIISVYDSCGFDYPLKYIHLGHDEPAYYEYLFLGGIIPGEHGEDKPGSPFIARSPRMFSKRDRDWVKNFVKTTKYTDKNISVTFQALFIRSLYTKVRLVKKYSPHTKVMIYGDVFDPCMGGVNTFLSSFVKQYNPKKYCEVQFVPDTSTGIAKLPGLSEEEKRFVRKNVILLPWNYNGKRTYAGVNPVREDYNTLKTFSYLKKNGFKFIYTFELIPKERSWPPDKNNLNQMYEFVTTAKLFPKNCLGYNAVHWGADWDNPKHRNCFKTMEELYKANQ